MSITNHGLLLGKFAPMHLGHKHCILTAATRCHKLTVLLCIDHLHDPKELSPEQRLEILNKELSPFGNISVEVLDCTSFPYAKEDDFDVSEYYAKALFNKYPDVGTLFGSEMYVKYMADTWPACNGVRCEIIDLDKKEFPISATQIRNNPINNFKYLVDSAKQYYTKHVLIIGSESCGKSTLVKNLSKLLKAPMVPEMYRSIYPDKGMTFSCNDLVEVANIQNAAVKCQVASPMNKGIIIHDTCNDVTSIYCKKYYPTYEFIHREIARIRDSQEVRFDLVLFCDIDIPWEKDGTRTLGDENERKEMRDIFYSLAIEKANRCGCPVAILPPDYKRLPEALRLIETL